jgi:ABC-2 type transport system ATP-binding protein
VLRLVVEGDVDAVIKAAAGLTVTGIRTYETDLEEVFFTLYEGGA